MPSGVYIRNIRVNKIELKCLFCCKKFLIYEKKTKRGRGKFCSKECYSKWQSIYKSKENHPHWKGGNVSENQKFRNTKEYREWRQLVLSRDLNCCIQCGSCEKLEVDHIKPSSKYPELRFDIDNGRTLCRECHKKTDTYGYKIIKK